jgi:hypothetical protein
MARSGIVAAGVVALVFAAAAASAPSPSLFPLADGNRWLLRDAERGATSIVSVRRQGRGYVLRGFPGAGDLRVRAAGEALQAWDSREARWEPFLPLGSRAGTTQAVDLGATDLWRNVLVTVASRNATVGNNDGSERRGCTLLTFRSKGKLVDAGLEEMAFAPRVGPVRIVEQTIAGPREKLLVARTVRTS